MNQNNCKHPFSHKSILRLACLCDCHMFKTTPQDSRTMPKKRGGAHTDAMMKGNTSKQRGEPLKFGWGIGHLYNIID